jgi:putative transposase
MPRAWPYYCRIKMSRRTSQNRNRETVQRALPLRTWGGSREGAGRRPAGSRARVPHVTRQAHAARHPVHVTLRAQRRLPSLRKQSVFFDVRRSIAKSSGTRFRVVQFSVQQDHVHLIVEAFDKRSLSNGVAGLAIRVARAVNRRLGRCGKVWGDRYHARAMRTPREVRQGIVYVLMNFKKHHPDATGFDVCSSAWWFDGWKRPPTSGPPGWGRGEVCVRPPGQWLLKTGWRRYGLLGAGEGPRA